MPKHLCYYEALGVARNADDVEIKKAFRRLAMKHHPDIEPAESSKEEFRRVCEAYEVLSSAKLKGTYDLYGEEVLKSTAEGGGSYSFDAEQGPKAVFSRFFGTANPYEALNALSAHFEKLTTQVKTQPGQPQEVELLVTMEEVAKGATKVVQHSRRVLSEGGEGVVLQQVSVRVEVKPGQLEGTRYVFEGHGDAVTKNQPAGPLVVVLASAPHPVFSRRGASDLKAKLKLPLLNALTGGCVRLDTLDGRVLSVPLDEVVTPGLVMKVAGEGLPLPVQGGHLKGDLFLEFELLFPQHLTQQQKMLLAAGFYLPAKPDTAASKALREFEAAYRDAKHGWSSGVLKDGAVVQGGQ